MANIKKQLKFDDVRMRGFKKRSTVNVVLEWLEQQGGKLSSQAISLHQANGRMLALDVVSQVNIPGFPRSMMDGYAIIAADTQGASAYNQLPFQVVGKSLPGQGANIRVRTGTAVKIMTGAPIPDGANAVLPVEKVEVDGDSIFVMENVAEGRNIARIGEDISKGQTILHRNRILRPQDIGLLASIGLDKVSVIRQPQVRIVATGNELLSAGNNPDDYRIVNSNGPMLEALAIRDGGHVVSSKIVADDEQSIREALLEDCDILIISGGTSVGEEDLVPSLLAEEGELVFHGVAMRPSRSAGVGVIGSKMIFLIPGNPVACLCAYDFFAGRYLRKLAGKNTEWPYISVLRKLDKKLVSMVGRTDYVRVRLLSDNKVEPLAISGAGILSSTTEADGFAIVPGDSEGYEQDTEIEVFLYDQNGVA